MNPAPPHQAKEKKLLMRDMLIDIQAQESEIIMLRACNDTLVKREQQARVFSNAVLAKLHEKDKALQRVWDWCVLDNPIEIDGDYIKRVLDL